LLLLKGLLLLLNIGLQQGLQVLQSPCKAVIRDLAL
jgi:hypothetical protein